MATKDQYSEEELSRKFNKGIKVNGKQLYPQMTFSTLEQARRSANQTKTQYPNGIVKIKKLGKKTYGVYSRVP